MVMLAQRLEVRRIVEQADIALVSLDVVDDLGSRDVLDSREGYATWLSCTLDGTHQPRPSDTVIGLQRWELNPLPDGYELHETPFLYSREGAAVGCCTALCEYPHMDRRFRRALLAPVPYRNPKEKMS